MFRFGVGHHEGKAFAKKKGISSVTTATVEWLKKPFTELPLCCTMHPLEPDASYFGKLLYCLHKMSFISYCIYNLYQKLLARTYEHISLRGVKS